MDNIDAGMNEAPKRWISWSWRKTLSLSLAASALIFGIAVYSTVHTGAGVASDIRLVDHSHDVLEGLEAGLSHLRGSEAGQRGFLLTENESYLTPYHESVNRVRRIFKQVRRLTSDNFNQQHRLDELEPLVDRRIAQLENNIRLQREGKRSEVVAALLTGTGKATMEAIYAQVAAMAADEKALLRTRRDTVEQSTERLKTLMVGAICVTLLIFGFVFASISREMMRNELAKLELRTVRDELEVRVLQRTEQLAAAKVEADAANRAKSQFLAQASHKFRTPLNHILGFGQLLAMDDLTAEQRESVEEIIRAGRGMTESINQVLDVARTGSGESPLLLESVRVEDVLRDAAEVARPLAKQRQVTLPTGVFLSTMADTAIAVADRRRLQHVFANLFSNAVKFNRPKGEVNVFAEKTGDNKLRVGIRNSGEPLTGQTLRNFKAIAGEGGNPEDVGDSTGLGLVVAKSLIHSMHGRIDLETTPGAGSTFTVELPMPVMGQEISDLALAS